MSGADPQAAYAALHGPSPAELVRGLPDIADGLAARLHALARDPTLEAAEQLVRDAGGLTTLGMRLSLALRQEGRVSAT